MIGTENVIINECLLDPAILYNIFGYEKIIDAPTDITIPGLKTVSPPRVFFGIREKMPERVHIAVLDNPIQPVPFDSQKPGCVLIGFWVFQIDLVVGCIIVSGND